MSSAARAVPGEDEVFAPGSVVHRETARVLPVDARGRVLLLHGWEPAKPDMTFWFTVGGACEAGETLSEAAARELQEETGLLVQPEHLGEPIATHQHEFGWNGLTLIQVETYFAVAVASDKVSFSGMEATELATTDRAQWWTPDELRTDGTAGFPQLPDLLMQAIAAVGR